MASQAFLLSLKKGQILRAKIEEVQSSQLLCNFQGELLLVGNHTGKVFKKDEPISLQVISSDPLQFQIFSSAGQFTRVI
jgi:hypothetical protein